MEALALNELIRNRRAVYPKIYNDKLISKDIVNQILENANWAPTHRKTEPWRFKVYAGASKNELGTRVFDYLNANVPYMPESKKKRAKAKYERSSHVVIISMLPDQEKRIPEWEELAATACAVQNMWLSCTAYGIGCYWSSPKVLLSSNELFNLPEEERCLGIFYMGYYDTDIELQSQRTDIASKVKWYE